MDASVAPAEAPEAADLAEPADGPGRLGWLDAVIAVGLALLAGYMRRSSYPTDGLWLDDAWVAVSARAPLSDLLSVSWNHPGFTLFLQAVNKVEPDRIGVLSYPVLVGGVLGVPLLYLCCRVLGFVPIAAVPGAVALAVNRTHATYSGRIKPYVFEMIGILLLAVALHLVIGRRWRWPLAAAWVTLALAVSTISAFGFAAAALATLVVALHPAGDRPIRLVVLAVQGAVQLALGLLTRRRYNSAEVAAIWERHYNAYIELDDGPIDVLRQLVDHLARLAETWVEAPTPIALAVLGVSLAGLGWACVRGRHRAVARFLIALPLLALVGSILQQVPFGPTPDRSLFPGSRGSIWLYPSIAFGLAVAVDAAIRAATKAGERRRWVPPVVLGGALAATLVLVAVKYDEPIDYGTFGVRRATTYIESVREEGDVVFFFEVTRYVVAAEPPLFVEIRPDPDAIEGFRPIPGNGRVVIPPRPEITRERISEIVGDATRVFIHDAYVGFADGDLPLVEAQLEALGFELAGIETFGANAVHTWTR